MKSDNRNFIIITKHRRGKRLWQFFFTGWGVVMVAVLVAASLFTQELLWTPISAINMTDIVSNQYTMSRPRFAGTDTNGEPFNLSATSARQEYNNLDVIILDHVNATVNRITDGKKTTDTIYADIGRFNLKQKTIKLDGNVRIDSSNGDKVLTDELVVKL